MAEARLGVDPRPTVSHIGFEVDTGRKESQLHVSKAGVVLYIPHPRFLLKNLKKTIRRLYSKAVYACVPFPVWLPTVTVTTVMVWVVRSPGSSWQRSGMLANVLWKIDGWNPLIKLVERFVGSERMTTPVRVAYLAGTFTALSVSAITFWQRFCLRHLLNYHGWLKESHGKKSLVTKVWGFLMRYIFVRGGNLGGTYVYQDILPTLPLPSLNDTVDRYLESMVALLNEEEMAECQKLAADFRKQEGPNLQWWLKLKWWTSSNYLSDWWLNFVYLRGRDPLPINSNWYGVLSEEYRPTKDMAARGASLVYNFMLTKRSLESETFQPLVIAGIAPLCMAQYENAFSMTRIPGREQDQLAKAEPGESKHIVVIFKGRFYKLSCYSPKTNMLLSPLQLYHALKGILDSSDSTHDDEAGLPALTTMDRTEWCEVRDKYFMSNAYNKERLEIIEKAAFCFCFDDFIPDCLSQQGKRLLTGSGRTFWCDKSLNLVVDATCQGGMHVEHGWGDAPAMSHVMETCSNREISKENYNPDGSIKATKEDLSKQKANCFRVYPAERIKFQISAELQGVVAKAEADYKQKIDEVELYTLKFKHYGKQIPKKARCSPDSWIQMCFQLAYWRDQGRFDQTYEASMTRLFLNGRTETVRSACKGSLDFVKLMEDPTASKADRLKALQVACSYHQELAQSAMIGKGCDRHLFALYVVSIGKSIESPFLKFALGRKWKLSTSQTPNQQTPNNLGKMDEGLYMTPNGGFGPVADDGYGISYVVYSNILYFNISAKNTKGNTNASKLGAGIEKALLEMAELVK